MASTTDGTPLSSPPSSSQGEATSARDFWTASTAFSGNGWSCHIHSSRPRTERWLMRTPLGFPVVPEV